MGLFKEFEKSTQVFNPVNNAGSDTITYPDTPSLIIPMHIIRLSNSEINVFGDEISDHTANPDGDVSASILRNAKLIQDGKTFKNVNYPEYRPNMNVTSLDLKRIESNE